MKTPFNKPFVVGKELHYIAQAVFKGQLAGNGFYTKACQNWIEETYRIRKALLTHSGTAALEMAALLVNIQPGDEFIVLRTPLFQLRMRSFYAEEYRFGATSVKTL